MKWHWIPPPKKILYESKHTFSTKPSLSDLLYSKLQTHPLPIQYLHLLANKESNWCPFADRRRFSPKSPSSIIAIKAIFAIPYPLPAHHNLPFPSSCCSPKDPRTLWSRFLEHMVGEVNSPRLLQFLFHQQKALLETSTYVSRGTPIGNKLLPT